MAEFKAQTSNGNRVYDLEERTALFGEQVIDFVKSLPKGVVNNELISQLVRSGTSIGANYMEADAAESRRDFQHKLGICKKEAKETLHWLQMVAKADTNKADRCRNLWKECHELVLIFSSIIQKL